MRYRLMASYLGAPYQAGVGPSDRDVTLFAAAPPPEDHGFAPAVGHWRRQVTINDVDALWESRPVGTYRSEPCLVLDDLGDRVHIAYLGMDERRALQLGYWQVDRGVFEVVVPRHEIRDLAEDRHEFPLATLRSSLTRALDAGGQPRSPVAVPGGPSLPPGPLPPRPQVMPNGPVDHHRLPRYGDGQGIAGAPGNGAGPGIAGGPNGLAGIAHGTPGMQAPPPGPGQFPLGAQAPAGTPGPGRAPAAFGPPGPPGPQGGFGAQDAFGPPGAFGAQDAFGPPGAFGAQDAFGPQGGFGPPGAFGAQPAFGAPGPGQGPTGMPGGGGVAGPAGSQGPAALQNVPGMQGVPGGMQGVPGMQGASRPGAPAAGVPTAQGGYPGQAAFAGQPAPGGMVAPGMPSPTAGALRPGGPPRPQPRAALPAAPSAPSGPPPVPGTQAPGAQHPSLPPMPAPAAPAPPMPASGASAWHGSPLPDDNAPLYYAATGNGAGYGDGPAAQLATGFPGGTGYAAPNGNGQDRPGGQVPGQVPGGQGGILPQGQQAMPGTGSFNGTQNGQYAPWPDANGSAYGTPTPFNGAGLNGTPSYPGMAGYPSPSAPASAPQAYPNAQQPRLMPEPQFVAHPQRPAQQSLVPPLAPPTEPQAQLLHGQSPVIHPLSTQPPTVRPQAANIPVPSPIGQPAGLPRVQPQVTQYLATPEAVPQPQVPQPPAAPALSPQAPAQQAQASAAAVPQLARPAGAPAGPSAPPPSHTPAVNSLIESAVASQSGSTVRGRRAARKPRLAMSAVFADLVDMADISRSAYAVDDEVTGSMCLFKTDGGYEVFSCAEDARHEVRFFEEEEAAYFYLFGVLAAEAVRNGRLKPSR